MEKAYHILKAIHILKSQLYNEKHFLMDKHWSIMKGICYFYERLEDSEQKSST